MPINFHNPEDRFTYAKRNADATWIQLIKKICTIEGKKVIDIGCGGGIYTKALAEMGALKVTGLDFSENILTSAQQNCKEFENINFIVGNALETDLPSEQYDIVLERAVIHHIKDLDTCFKEIYRLLKNGGSCIIQDRTPEDFLLEGSTTHIRGYFFSKFPELIDKEISRRYSSEEVQQALQNAGFHGMKEYQLWETRKVYEDKNDLFDDLYNRTGRSILHELTDEQLQDLVLYIKEKLNSHHQPIIEQDRWTIWKADK
ncbi:class I SAM-dependent methyltransferase [Heyndrickxia sp. NPDC080065]|uniref:class I SAM-dependent methyltransferase n=1 Tax=Heyndrickxia sp. NPDC080065 TaxID=3390568 RepID=UPI003D06DC5C